MYLCSMEMQLFKNITPQNMPERMNNPFSYEPHPLCIEACRELQAELSQRNDWREEIDRGKMFGVLIVEADNSKIGYLKAYSGQIGGRSDWEGFVPAVFDYLQPDGYFKVHEAEISEINQQIRQFEANENLIKAKNLIDDLQQKRQEVIANYQTKIRSKGKARCKAPGSPFGRNAPERGRGESDDKREPVYEGRAEEAEKVDKRKDGVRNAI